MAFKAFAKVALRLGCLGFGGPAAAMAMIEEECSRKREWLSRERFSHLLTICKLFPGPVATQMMIAIGSIRHGVAGGVVGGLLFILPAFILVLGMGAWYQNSAEVISKAGLLWSGLQTGAIAVILASVVQLARPYRQSRRAWAIGLISAGVVAIRPQIEPALILGFGLLSYAGFRLARSGARLHAFGWALLGLADEQLRQKALQIFWICFKAGAFVFGTGLAVVPVLEGDFVGRMGWLTHAQFMDGLAVGQITPGPVTITATFLGFQVMGLVGALVATAGVFSAAFVNGLFVIPRVWGHLEKRAAAGPAAFVAGAVPAVVGGVFGTGTRLAIQTGHSAGAQAGVLAVVLAASLVAQFRYRVPAWAVIPGAGVLAWVLKNFEALHFTG
jgi:chromate transporter